MKKTENAEDGGCLQRDSVEHKEYAEAYSTEGRKTEEKDGADLLERVLDRGNLNRAYKRVKANKGASGIDGMTVEEALPWLKENGEEQVSALFMIEPPCTERYARWCERSATQLMGSLLLDQLFRLG